MSHAVAMLSVHTSPLALPGSAKDAGGMNVYIRELARELGRPHFTIDIFARRTQSDQPEIVYLTPHVRVIFIEAGPAAPVEKHDLYHYIPVFAQKIEEFSRRTGKKYDLLHSHYWLSGVAAQQLARSWDIPHITMFHTLAHLKQLANPAQPEPALRLEMERQLIAHAERIIATTAEERTQMMRHCGATSNQVEVIPCGVDLHRFVGHEQREARIVLGLNPDQPVLLFVGRLDPFKGPDVFLKAAAMMQKKAQLVIVGGNATGDPEIEKLRQLACDLRIHKRVYFLGARPQEDLPLIYSAADVTVVPSYHESFGMAAVESLACGTPVVATRAGGLITVVCHGKTGYLVPRCPGFFAERLDSLLRSPATLASMRQAARSSITQYSWEMIARDMREVYEAVLSQAGEEVQALPV
ncbi:MAG TPA: glycosyltransferase [Ktedonobacteraceae bacterium]|nr:glycosyltransferase [Ktedonobacteraceae bacterium]